MKMKAIITGFILFTGILHAQDTIIMPPTGNGGFYNTCYAIIFDNGADSNYVNFSHSTITISPLWVENISIYFAEFNTETYFDSLTMYDGPGTTFPRIGTFSGNSLQGQTIQSTGNSITLEFRSDDVVTGTGFKAEVSCILGNPAWEQQNLRVFPNPARDFLQVQSMEMELLHSYTITDITGRVVDKKNISGSIDISRLAPGSYGLILQLKNGSTKYIPWIKE
jgi:hypothetical protein